MKLSHDHIHCVHKDVEEAVNYLLARPFCGVFEWDAQGNQNVIESIDWVSLYHIYQIISLFNRQSLLCVFRRSSYSLVHKEKIEKQVLSKMYCWWIVVRFLALRHKGTELNLWSQICTLEWLEFHTVDLQKSSSQVCLWWYR